MFHWPPSRVHRRRPRMSLQCLSLRVCVVGSAGEPVRRWSVWASCASAAMDHRCNGHPQGGRKAPEYGLGWSWRGQSLDHFRRTRSEDPALLPCREVAARNHCPAIGRTPWHGGSGALSGRVAEAGAAPSRFAPRPVSALCPDDSGAVPDAHRQSPLRHGARARLRGRRRPLSPPDAALPSAGPAGGVSAPEDPARGAGPGRLGALWNVHRRACRAAPDGAMSWCSAGRGRSCCGSSSMHGWPASCVATRRPFKPGAGCRG